MFVARRPQRARRCDVAANAIKFTDHGQVEVAVAAVEGYLHFAVTDSGIGIPADKLDTIFEKFSQADSSTTRRYLSNT